MEWYHTLFIFIAAGGASYAAGASIDIYKKLNRVSDDLYEIKKKLDL